MTVAEVVPITGALAIFGAAGFLHVVPSIISLALCGAMLGFLFQSPGRQAFSRRCRQPAGRLAARLAAR
jgi:hypothetical protein